MSASPAADQLIPDLPRLTGPTGVKSPSSGASASARRALPKSRFVRKSDRICVRQVPSFKKIEVQVERWDREYSEAIEAEDLEAALFALRKFGNQAHKIANLLDKRKRLIKRLLPVRGKSPRYFIRTLDGLARADRKLARAAHAVADSPTEQNIERLKSTYGPLDKAGDRYFKAARGYGFRKCSKALARR